MRNFVVPLLFFMVTQLSSCWSTAAGLDDSGLRRFHEVLVNHLTQAHANSLYPSGGHRGWQLGAAILSPPTYESSNLKNLPSFFKDPLFRLNLSKGLFYNFDLGLSWLPPLGQTYQGYGGWIQALIVETPEAPLGLLGVYSWNHFDHSSLVQHQISALKLSMQYTGIRSWYYFGFAQEQHESRFQGGPQGITLSAITEKFSTRIIRPHIGGGFKISNDYQWGAEVSYVISLQWALQWIMLW
ncbi:MAG: hypothetical protein N2Z70_03720 [Bdellovibrionaceae bacterium]|nr:hypothetical protein [Pseudobdellovibrionaceae bacterium]